MKNYKFTIESPFLNSTISEIFCFDNLENAIKMADRIKKEAPAKLKDMRITIQDIDIAIPLDVPKGVAKGK